MTIGVNVLFYATRLLDYFYYYHENFGIIEVFKSPRYLNYIWFEFWLIRCLFAIIIFSIFLIMLKNFSFFIKNFFLKLYLKILNKKKI